VRLFPLKKSFELRVFLGFALGKKLCLMDSDAKDMLNDHSFLARNSKFHSKLQAKLNHCSALLLHHYRLMLESLFIFAVNSQKYNGVMHILFSRDLK